MDTNATAPALHSIRPTTDQERALAFETVSIDPNSNLLDLIPDTDDPIDLVPTSPSHADTKRVQNLHALTGPGPHLGQLTDTEHDALITHLLRIDEAIERYQNGTATDADFPLDCDDLANEHGTWVYRGAGTIDDPSEIDYLELGRCLIPELEDVRTAWIDYAEALSAARPVF